MIPRIYLSLPHMSGLEQPFVQDAFASNWIATLGPHVDAFEQGFCEKALGSLPGISFMPEALWGRHTRWLTCMLIDADAFRADREQVRQALEAENIEARPVWKPMHLQPVFAGYETVGGQVAESLFERGLCLPSGSHLTERDLERVVDVIIQLHYHKSQRIKTLPT